MRRSTSGMVRMVGPMSKRKPAPLRTAALPPSHGLLSNRTTEYPRAASVQAAASPPSPPPITPTRSLPDFATGNLRGGPIPTPDLCVFIPDSGRDGRGRCRLVLRARLAEPGGVEAEVLQQQP